MEYALGSAREARDWYYKSHHILPENILGHRIGLLTRIIRTLIVLVTQQREQGIREASADYSNDSLSEASLFDAESTRT